MNRKITDLNYEAIVTEEVALEGLDGITLSALWTRISTRPNFTGIIDLESKNYFWDLCTDHKSFQFYALPEARPPLVICNRFADDDDEPEFIEDDRPDLYPFSVIDEPNVWGSCATFYTRVNITTLIRPTGKQHMTLNEVEERWGDKLVIVASYDIRRKALLGEQCDPSWQMKNRQYVMLERIGRSRFQGEFTTGKNSLGLCASSKSLFYYRLALLNKGVITKQFHYFKPKNGSVRYIMLLHLTRFYVEHKSKLFKMMEDTCKYLSNKPGRMDLVQNLMTNLKVKKKEHFIKCIRKIAEIKMIPYGEFKSLTEDNLANKPSYSTKPTKVAILYKNVSIETLESILEGSDSKDFDEDASQLIGDDNDIEECSLKKPNVALITDSSKRIPDSSNQLIDQPVMKQAYNIFNQLGANGGTVIQFGKIIGFPRLDSRLLCNNLQRLNLTTLIKRDVGKQRESVYVAKNYINDSILPFHKECEKMIDFVAAVDQKTERNSFKKASSLNADEKVEVKKGDSSEPKGVRPLCTLMEDIQLLLDNNPKSSSSMTLKSLRRVNLILQAVRNAKLIDTHVALHKLIVNEESEDGGGRMDLKSLMRLLKRLQREGYIRIIQSLVTTGNREKKIQFICDPSVQPEDSIVVSALEQAKLKFLASAQEDSPPSVPNSVSQLRSLHKKENEQPRIYSHQLGRLYGHEPKFVRCRLLHEFLFYLTYDYNGQENVSVPERSLDCNVSSLPKMYYYEKEPSWKMFVSPLPIHYGWNTGWCLMSDILLRLPLSLLVRIVCYNYKIYGIEEFLNHPVKRHIPISFLPFNLRNQLLHTRKYIFSAYECAQKLYYMGLLSFGSTDHKSKDMVFFFLHRHSRVVDTSLSRPSYYKTSTDIEYPIRNYLFKNGSDLQMYWSDLESVCRSTSLGSSHVSTNETLMVNIEILEKKISVKTIQPSEENEKEADSGIPPGDQRGAGGLDSSFFAHLIRSWNWNQPKFKGANSKIYKTKKNTNDAKCLERPGAVSPSFSVLFKNKTALPLILNGRNRMARLVINKQLQAMADGDKTQSKAMGQMQRLQPKKSTVRHVKPRKPPRMPTPKYDEIDKLALTKIRKKRVNWNVKEDSLLLLGKVAYVLMFDHRRNSLSCRWIRDFLHTNSQVSNDKTSIACQRRINYMLKNLQTGYHVSVFVGEARQDEAILEQCKGLDTLSPINDKETFKKRFDAIMAILMTKFQNGSFQPSANSLQLPSSLEDLRDNYEVTYAKNYWGKSSACPEVDTKEDILYHLSVSLILSAIAGFKNDEQQMPQQLYGVLRRLPDQILLKALNSLKSSGVISCKKAKSRRKVVRSSPVFGTLTYGLSINYLNMLRSKYPEECFTHMNSMMHQLSQNAKAKNSKPLKIVIDQEAGYAILIASLNATRKIDFEFVIPDEIVTLGLTNNRKDKINEELENEYLSNDESTPKKQKRDYEERSQCSSKATKRHSLNEKSLSPEEIVLGKDIPLSGEPPPKKQKVANEDKNDPSSSLTADNFIKVESAHSKVAFKLASKSSRLALYMLRQDMEEIRLKTVQHSQDYLVIKPCILSCRLNNLEPDITSRILQPTSSFLEYLPTTSTYLDEMLTQYKITGKSQDTIKNAIEIYHKIYDYGEIGIRYTYLKDWFCNANTTFEARCDVLLSCLRDMENANVILRVGVETIRFVSNEHSSPWKIQFTCKNQIISENSQESDASSDSCSKRQEREVCFVPKIWRRSDGSLNVPIFRQLLVSIMGRIMSYPGVNFDKLYAHFRNVFSPVQLHELLIILMDIGCIKKMQVTRNHKPSLFSTRPKFEMADVIDSNVVSGSVCYEADVEGPQKLSTYLFNESTKK